jgi:hypothetical protein
MSRICPDCKGLKDGSGSLEDPHEYLVPAGRSKSGGSVFYKCLLCNTFLTFVPEDGATRWNAGFQPHRARAAALPAAN